jgi:hypothetical protein
MIYFYLFENQTDLLDKVDKIANIIIASFTLIFSIYIFWVTKNKEEKNNESTRKIDFLKTIVLDNNLVYFFNFHEQISSFLESFKNRQITNQDRVTINILLIEELTKYRIKFYDLILPLDRNLYSQIKTNSDTLIDELTVKIFDTSVDYLNSQNFETHIMECIMKKRTESLKALYDFK